MAERQPLFSPDERRVFFDEMWAKFRNGLRSSGFLYVAVTAIGVGWASFGIPSINNSEISPETLGIYVIGFLISVMLDSFIVAWRNRTSISTTESNILGVLSVGALLLTCWASYLAIKNIDVALDPPQRDGWKYGATPLLIIILTLAICMSLIVSGMDSAVLKIPAADSTPNVTDK